MIEGAGSQTARALLTLSEMRKAASSATEGEWVGYVGSSYPTRLDLAMESVVNTFLVSSTETRDALLRVPLADFEVEFLSRYSERMAAVAVHRRLERFIVDGLVALIILNGQVRTQRLLFLLMSLFRSARKMGTDPVLLFKQAARITPSETRTLLRRLPHRHP